VIEAKAAGHEVKAPEEAPRSTGQVVDLMDALRRSVAEAKERRGDGGAKTAARTTAKAPAKQAAKKTAKKTTKAATKKTAAKKAGTAKKAPAKKSATRRSA